MPFEKDWNREQFDQLARDTDDKTARSMMAAFLKGLSDTMAQAGEWLRTGNYAEIARAAHRIAPSAFVLGFTTLAELSESLDVENAAQLRNEDARIRNWMEESQRVLKRAQA